MLFQLPFEVGEAAIDSDTVTVRLLASHGAPDAASVTVCEEGGAKGRVQGQKGGRGGHRRERERGEYAGGLSIPPSQRRLGRKMFKQVGCDTRD